MKKKTTTGHHHEPSNRSSTSCAACKLLKRRCGPSCIFAPYFRADEPKKFAQVHKVFGASNVSKILNEVPEEHREDTVNSLSYEAEARLRDPVYGCIGAIAILQHRMAELQHDLALARARLAGYGAVRGNSSSNNNNNNGCDNSYPLEVVDYCASNCVSSSSCNVVSDHVRLPISQIESSQLSQTSAYSSSTNNFGQVPLLPL